MISFFVNGDRINQRIDVATTGPNQVLHISPDTAEDIITALIDHLHHPPTSNPRHRANPTPDIPSSVWHDPSNYGKTTLNTPTPNRLCDHYYRSDGNGIYTCIHCTGRFFTSHW